ncbi:uncharacterized protein BDV17DRAFT_291522 [Aspergillus undulatus]|uniref:uncharacterized protein n=1 Tax=Aspergillus undulatus TaxID=1810928 RepID=UPI003CCDC7C2
MLRGNFAGGAFGLSENGHKNHPFPHRGSGPAPSQTVCLYACSNTARNAGIRYQLAHESQALRTGARCLHLAANLAEKLMKNHAYTDGNKRTALVAADMFLKINGFCLQKEPFAEDAHNVGITRAHVALATNEWTVEQLADYYKSVSIPYLEEDPEVVSFKNEAAEY